MSDDAEQAIRADERRIFADYFDLRAQEIAEHPDQYRDLRLLRGIYLDVANTIRFNETAGGKDGHPISAPSLRSETGGDT